jgi:DNA-binding response OmpR family regulator
MGFSRGAILWRRRGISLKQYLPSSFFADLNKKSSGYISITGVFIVPSHWFFKETVLQTRIFAVFSFSPYTMARRIQMAEKVLIVEDDANLLETLKYNLRKEGYNVVTAGDGEQAVTAARQEKPALLILDIMLPKMNGFEVCRILRKEMTIPILMLTAKADETDKIVGLEIGADDYMTKPFSIRELLARVRAMLRRVKMSETPAIEITSIKIGNLEVDIARHRASLSGALLELSPKEFDLLAFLARNKGLVFNREQLLEKVWGYNYAGDTRTVDVHIRWLRQKIEREPTHPEYILTIRGTGYKLEG